MTRTAIEWATDVWNPTTGCDRVSPGCDRCYALTLAARLQRMERARIDAGALDPARASYQRDGSAATSGPGFGLATHPDRLDIPLRQTRPRRYFVNSMSDLFHADVPDAYIARAFAVMAVAPRHRFLVLTKRHARMRSLLNSPAFGDVYDLALRDLMMTGVISQRACADAPPLPLPNVWLGVSVETQQWADIRIPALLDTPAAVRFLSCEPLLGPIDILRALSQHTLGLLLDDCHRCCVPESVHGGAVCERFQPPIGWVIVGGESGPGARPMDPEWARDLRDQTTAAGVPFFFKQWGGRTPKAGGRELDGRTWDELPA